MKAEVLGIAKTDFMGDRGPVRNTKYHVTIDSGDIAEGKEVGYLMWNEIENGKPPNIKVGQTIDVRYNNKGKLVLENDPSALAGQK